MKHKLSWPTIVIGIAVIATAAVVGVLPNHAMPRGTIAPAFKRALAQTATTPASAAPTSSGASASAPSPTPTPQASLPARIAGTHSTLSTPTSQAGTPTGTPSSTSGKPAPSIACQPRPTNDFATCLFTEASGKSLTFYLWVPLNYKPAKKYPLVLVLEGGGERYSPNKTAEQNRKTLLSDPYAAVWGPGVNLPDSPQVQQQWPSFIVIPQIPGSARWVDVLANVGSYTMAPQPNDSLRMTKEVVDGLQQIYKGIDANRLYLTGLSMGGYGAWEMAERWPNEWAAVGPMCGAGDPSKASVLKNVPIWAFHASQDPIVPVTGSRDMIAAIRAAGGHPRYTELEGSDHGIWTYAYQILGKPTPTPGFYQWLFSQHKGVGTGATP